jgi:hypothetical protein
MANIINEFLKDFPESFRSGDILKVERSDFAIDYPPTTFTAVFKARKVDAGGTNFSVQATNNNGNFLFTFSSSVTANYTVGMYKYVVTVTDSSSNRVTVDEGKIEVLEDLINTSTTELRSHAKILLDKIESLLSGKADSDVSNYSINNRSLTKLSVDELLKWRDYYKAEYLREIREQRIKSGQGSGSNVLVRFR